MQGKTQKHQAFAAELNANRSRLDAVDATGQHLISENHYASDLIQQRLDELHELWRYLFESSDKKGTYCSIYQIRSIYMEETTLNSEIMILAFMYNTHNSSHILFIFKYAPVLDSTDYPIYVYRLLCSSKTA